ncbi:MBL fold metallo-hydrolase [Pseudomonas sp. ES3-33]|uniref:MBL fold metallo-hydrolase n=1 Tax=Pseudomonas sp. ES3-33 TaxID=1628833 RepID=UPI0005D3B3E0|nr:MBL fold metallo-hydrolase [Pseudomonas sp. ES3-33]KJH77459.1 beta-lactamase [Pseudomonas sp. ES3-33]
MNILHSFIVSSVAVFFLAAGSASATPLAQAPGYYRIPLGDFKVTVLSDGTAPRDLASIMSKPAVVRAAYAAAHEALPVELSINCFLIDTGKQRILVDTGAGELFGPGSGKVVANLQAAGYKPEDIDTILLTHIHADHSGGLTVAGKRVFPKAAVYVDKADPALWLSQAEEAKVPADRKTTFEQSRKTVGPYVDSGQLKTFTAPVNLFPGVSAIPLHGHTPGHTGYMIESKGQKLLLWGDTVHSTEVQLDHPDITIQYDVNATDAASSRLKALEQAGKEGYLVGGAHISFPGFGHVEHRAAVYIWHPIPYSATD